MMIKFIINNPINRFGVDMSVLNLITIDGPSGSGKGTVCHILAKKLQWHLLDSGALYRILAYAALQNNISLTDAKALSN